MDLINNPREYVPQYGFIVPNMEMVDIRKQNIESGQGSFPKSFNEVPPLDQIKSWISSTKISTKFSNPNPLLMSVLYLHFVLVAIIKDLQ